MGLDMYLEVEDKYGELDEFMYWRKANAIHRWFVEKVQDGNDDCEKYEVSYEKLYELKNLCEKVINNTKKAHELLPTASGFFFGETSYGEWYFHNIENTIASFDKLDPKSKYYYQSCW